MEGAPKDFRRAISPSPQSSSSPSLFSTPSLSPPSFSSSLSAFLSGLGGEESSAGTWGKGGEEGELTDGLWLLSVSRDKTVCLVSLRQLTHIATFGPHPSPVKGFFFILSCSMNSHFLLFRLNLLASLLPRDSCLFPVLMIICISGVFGQGNWNAMQRVLKQRFDRAKKR